MGPPYHISVYGQSPLLCIPPGVPLDRERIIQEWYLRCSSQESCSCSRRWLATSAATTPLPTATKEVTSSTRSSSRASAIRRMAECRLLVELAHFALLFSPVPPCRNYVDAQTALDEGLLSASGDHFVLRADYKKQLDPNGPGRDSVRLRSQNTYTTSVIVYVLILSCIYCPSYPPSFNLRHMPQGCG